MQPSSLPRGLEVPSSFGARRSISHDLARFSLDLAPERRISHRVPYPSPPMSHSPPPPPLNSLSPNDPRLLLQTPSFYASNGAGQIQPSYGAAAAAAAATYRYSQDRQEPTPPPFRTTNPAPPGDPDSFPTPFPLIGTADRLATQIVSAPGRSPFVPQPAFPPPPPPRRPKSHVASACVNCKKAHLACDTRRPCPRCIGLGKQETCVDVQHKKRGRPRLRDDHRSHSFEISQRPGILSSPSSPTIPVSYRSGTHRILKSQSNDNSRYSRRPSLTPREDILGHASGYFDQRSTQRPSRINLPPISNATAYLTTDLVVAKSTEGMRELLGYAAADLDCQKSLFDIVLATDIEKVEHLLTRVREEMKGKEPKHWLTGTQLYSTIQAVNENQISSATQGATNHMEVLHLRRPDGTYLRIRIRANLASASVYFVVMVFSLANEMPPPLQLNSSSVSYANTSRLHTPTPISAPPLHSPSFSTSTHHLQIHGGPSAPQPPFSHPGMSLNSSMESRPRTMQHESSYPLPVQYMNPSPSPASSTFYRPPISPASVTPASGLSTPRLQTPGIQQSDLQLPPLQLNPLSAYGGVDNRIRSTVVTPEEPGRIETPKRERIGVKEMLE